MTNLFLKGEAGCHLDRHENIGEGKIGLQGFARILNSPHFTGMKMSHFILFHPALSHPKLES